MVDFVSEPRVWETSTTTGTGTLDLDGISTEITGLRSFVGAGLGGLKVPYMIQHQTLDEFEFGVGTITDAAPDTLSRDSIFRSSNSDAVVSLSAGIKDVFLFDWPGFGGGTISTITGNTTLSILHSTLLCNSASDFTITLPAVADFQGKEYTVRNNNTGIVTLDGNGAEAIFDRINGSGTTLLLPITGDYVKIIADGTQWWVVEDGLIPHVSKMEQTSFTPSAAGTFEDMGLDVTLIDRGGLADPTTNNRFDVQRTGDYLCFISGNIVSADNQKSYVFRLHDGTNQLAVAAGRETDFSTVHDIATGQQIPFALTAGDAIVAETNHETTVKASSTVASLVEIR